MRLGLLALASVSGQQQQRAGQALLARVEELVDQVFFNPDVRGEHVRDESVRQAVFRVERPDHLVLVDGECRRGGQHSRGPPADQAACPGPFTKELPWSKDGHDGLFPGQGDHDSCTPPS